MLSSFWFIFAFPIPCSWTRDFPKRTLKLWRPKSFEEIQNDQVKQLFYILFLFPELKAFQYYNINIKTFQGQVISSLKVVYVCFISPDIWEWLTVNMSFPIILVGVQLVLCSVYKYLSPFPSFTFRIQFHFNIFCWVVFSFDFFLSIFLCGSN